eukprot:5928580-Pyramimonas_sp.AAC.1
MVRRRVQRFQQQRSSSQARARRALASAEARPPWWRRGAQWQHVLQHLVGSEPIRAAGAS